MAQISREELFEGWTSIKSTSIIPETKEDLSPSDQTLARELLLTIMKTYE